MLIRNPTHWTHQPSMRSFATARSLAALDFRTSALIARGLCFFLYLAFTSASQADEVSLGTGILSSSPYPGANERVLRPVASFRWETDRFSIRNNGPGLEADLFPSMNLDAGPILRFDGGRGDDIDDVVIQRLAEVDSGIEVGGYVSTGLPLKVLGVDDPAIVTARIELLQEVADGHGGLSYSFRAGAVRPMSDRVTVIVSAGLTGNDRNYTDAYFGISDQDSSASGLPVFSPSAGLTKLSLTTIISTKLNTRWSLTALINVARLVGDAADSPIVSIRGSKQQSTLGLFVSYRFGDR